MKLIRFLLFIPISFLVFGLIYTAIIFIGEHFVYILYKLRVLIFTAITIYLIIKFKGITKDRYYEYVKSNILVFVGSLLFWWLFMSIIEININIPYMIVIVFITYLILKYINKLLNKLLKDKKVVELEKRVENLEDDKKQ